MYNPKSTQYTNNLNYTRDKTQLNKEQNVYQ